MDFKELHESLKENQTANLLESVDQTALGKRLGLKHLGKGIYADHADNKYTFNSQRQIFIGWKGVIKPSEDDLEKSKLGSHAAYLRTTQSNISHDVESLKKRNPENIKTINKHLSDGGTIDLHYVKGNGEHVYPKALTQKDAGKLKIDDTTGHITDENGKSLENYEMTYKVHGGERSGHVLGYVNNTHKIKDNEYFDSSDKLLKNEKDYVDAYNEKVKTHGKVIFKNNLDHWDKKSPSEKKPAEKEEEEYVPTPEKLGDRFERNNANVEVIQKHLANGGEIYEPVYGKNIIHSKRNADDFKVGTDTGKLRGLNNINHEGSVLIYVKDGVKIGVVNNLSPAVPIDKNDPKLIKNMADYERQIKAHFGDSKDAEINNVKMLPKLADKTFVVHRKDSLGYKMDEFYKIPVDVQGSFKVGDYTFHIIKSISSRGSKIKEDSKEYDVILDGTGLKAGTINKKKFSTGFFDLKKRLSEAKGLKSSVDNSIEQYRKIEKDGFIPFPKED